MIERLICFLMATKELVKVSTQACLGVTVWFTNMEPMTKRPFKGKQSSNLCCAKVICEGGAYHCAAAVSMVVKLHVKPWMVLNT